MESPQEESAQGKLGAMSSKGFRPVEALAVYMIFLVTAVLIILWCVVLFITDSWVQKVSVYWTVEAGLFGVFSGRGVLAKVLGRALEPISAIDAQTMTRWMDYRVSWADFQQFVCNLPLPRASDMCFVWSRMHICTWILLATSILGIVCLGAGAFLLWNYAYVSARTQTRTASQALFLLAPVLQLIGTSNYIYWALGIGSLFPQTTAPIFGTSVIFASVLSVASAVPFFIMIGLLKSTVDEDRAEQGAAQKIYDREMAMYGSALPGATQEGMSWTNQAATFQTAASSMISQEGMAASWQQPQPWAMAPTIPVASMAPQHQPMDIPPTVDLHAGAPAPEGQGLGLSADFAAAPPPPPAGMGAGGAEADWQSRPAEIRKGATFMPEPSSGQA